MDKEVKNLIVEIDSIKTGKVGIFTFCRKNKIIDNAMFKVKSPNMYYNYRHHVDAENFYEWCEISKGKIFQFDGRVHVATEWENLMKYEMYRLIQAGELDRKVETEDAIYNLKVVWKGAELTPPSSRTLYK